MLKAPTAILAGVLWLAAAGCEKPDAQAGHVAEVARAGGRVDSSHSSAELLRRFRATVAVRPDSLRRASPSLERLVQRWAAAVQARDTMALNAMVIDRAEFAWLYYPSARLARPPYEMPPALLWEQVLARSDEGARKVLDRLGGRPLAVRSVRCAAPVETEGSNIVRQACVVRLQSASDTLAEERYFGSIIERDGRFKFMGFSNSL